MSFSITNSISSSKFVSLTEQLEIIHAKVVEVKCLPLGTSSTTQELVKDVVITLILTRMYQANLLQQIGLDASTRQLSRGTEADINVLSEAGRVIIPNRPRVTERFKDGI